MAANFLHLHNQNKYAQYQLQNRQNQSSTGTNPTSRLLALPAEMRNEIYEWALTAPQDGEIDITADWEPPGLLATCRQIRHEALGMYFLDNTFVFNIQNCDGSLHTSWLSEFGGYVLEDGADECNLVEYHTGNPNWQNLMTWMGGLYGLGYNCHYWLDDEIRNPRLDILIVAVGAILCNGLCQDRDWMDVEQDMEYLRLITAHYDGAWR